jgi:hypothetical protein
VGRDATENALPRDGIVKLLGMILSPGNSRHFPDAMATDPTLRQKETNKRFCEGSHICITWCPISAAPSMLANVGWKSNVVIFELGQRFRRAGPTRSGTPSRCRRALARRTITPKHPESGDLGSTAFERRSPVRQIE